LFLWWAFLLALEFRLFGSFLLKLFAIGLKRGTNGCLEVLLWSLACFFLEWYWLVEELELAVGEDDETVELRSTFPDFMGKSCVLISGIFGDASGLDVKDVDDVEDDRFDCSSESFLEVLCVLTGKSDCFPKSR